MSNPEQTSGKSTKAITEMLAKNAKTPSSRAAEKAPEKPSTPSLTPKPQPQKANDLVQKFTNAMAAANNAIKGIV